MLDLYHWEPNGAYLKPLIVLHEKGLAFRGHYLDLLARVPEPSRETLLPLEGEGPVLVHDGRQISESLFIMEYLEDAFPAVSLRPDDPLGHARVLAWGRFINEVFMPGANTLGCHEYLAPALEGRDISSVERAFAGMPLQFLADAWKLAFTDGYSASLLEDSRRKVGLGVRRIEDTLKTSQWLVGSEYSLADIDAFAISNSLPELTPDLVNTKDTPRLMDWLERIRQRKAVRAALGESRTGNPTRAFLPGPEHSRWG